VLFSAERNGAGDLIWWQGVFLDAAGGVSTAASDEDAGAPPLHYKGGGFIPRLFSQSFLLCERPQKGASNKFFNGTTAKRDTNNPRPSNADLTLCPFMRIYAALVLPAAL